MTETEYTDLKERLIGAGYQNEIDWAENIKPCEDAIVFFCEYSWVVLNSGMKEQVARAIWTRILQAIKTGKPFPSAFRHKLKTAAIQWMWENRTIAFETYQASSDKMAFISELKFIGKITQYHLAKNLGMDVCKPDRHLVRIAEQYNMTPEKMCKDLAELTGDRIATVDSVIWRSANLRWI